MRFVGFIGLLGAEGQDDERRITAQGGVRDPEVRMSRVAAFLGIEIAEDDGGRLRSSATLQAGQERDDFR